MQVILIRRKFIFGLALLGMAAMILNLAAINLFAANLDDVNMAALNGRVIAIDPGHGGIDSGAKHHGVIEKDVTLAMAVKLAAVLESHGAKVVFTRQDDTDYYSRGKGGKRNDLLHRVELIKTSGAELFVSMHCNAIRGGNWFGAQVFFTTNHQNNQLLAEAVQLALKEFPPGNKRQAKENSHVLILNSLTIPGVLVEAGYLTNQREAALLSDDAYQQQLANQVAKALAYYYMQTGGQ